MARGLKLSLEEIEGLYYLCTCREKKGTAKLRSYCAADLRFCFRIFNEKQFSHDRADCVTIEGKMMGLFKLN